MSKMSSSVFAIQLLLIIRLVFRAHLGLIYLAAAPVHARAMDRFDPATRGNLIAPVIIAVVVFVLAIAFVIYCIRANRISIDSWFRRRNPSLAPLPPSPRLNQQYLELEAMEPLPLRLSDLVGDEADRMSLRGFLASSDNVGLGIRNNDVVPAPAPAHDDPVTFGFGFDWPEPAPQVVRPAAAVTARDRRRHSSMLRSAGERARGQFAAPRRASAAL